MISRSRPSGGRPTHNPPPSRSARRAWRNSRLPRRVARGSASLEPYNTTAAPGRVACSSRRTTSNPTALPPTTMRRTWPRGVSCSMQWSASRASRAGGPQIPVTSKRRTCRASAAGSASATCPWRNRGITLVAPTAMLLITMLGKACMWTAPSTTPMQRMVPRCWASSTPWLRNTPLGRPVVPPVKVISAGSSAPRSATGTPSGLRASIRSRRWPGSQLAPPTRIRVSPPRPGRHDSSAWASGTPMKARASVWRTQAAILATPIHGSINTGTAPRRKRAATTRYRSTETGTISTTRSPRPTPSPARPAAMRPAAEWSSPKVICSCSLAAGSAPDTGAATATRPGERWVASAR